MITYGERVVNEHEDKSVKSRKALATFAYSAVLVGTVFTDCETRDTVQATLYPQDYLNSKSNGICDPVLETVDMPRRTRERAARECIESQAGKVALVTLNIGPEVGQQLSEVSQELIPNVFDGLLNPQLTTIIASNEAVNQFVNVNNTDCADSDDAEKYLARIADQQMDLSQYDKVIGVSDFPICGGTAEGVAHGADGSRYSVVHMPSSYGSDDEKEAMIQRGASTIAHEYGHLQKLVHASALSGGEFDHVMYLTDMLSDRTYGFSYFPRNDDETYDLNDFLRNSHFDEYGDTNDRMGGPDGRLLNSAQRRQLLWPRIVLGEIPEFRQTLNDRQFQIEYPKDKTHSYASLNLASPIAMDTDNNGIISPSHVFDQLVFDPVYTDEGGSPVLQVYLATGGRTQTLSFGNILMTTLIPEMTFSIGSQRVSLKFQEHSIAIEDVTNK